MTKRYQTWVGIGIGVLVLAAVFGGTYTLFGGGAGGVFDQLPLDRLGVSSASDEQTAGDEVPGIAAPQGGGDLQSFTNDADSGSDQADGRSRPALRVVVDADAPATTTSTTTDPNQPPTTPTTATPSTTTPTTATPSTTTPTTTAPSTTTQAPGAARSFERQVIEYTNEARAAAGCAALTHNDKLHAAALGHSTDMHDQGYFAHESLDGSEMEHRIDRQGYSWGTLAENIAAGYGTPRAAVDGWMNSPDHRRNILNCNLTEIGVGFHNFYWTQNFATPR